MTGTLRFDPIAEARRQWVSHRLGEPQSIRGESAYLIETESEYLAHVEEGLGTKNLVADAMLQAAGKSYYSLHICVGGKDGYLVEKNAAKLGKVKTGRSCINFNKLEDLKPRAPVARASRLSRTKERDRPTRRSARL